MIKARIRYLLLFLASAVLIILAGQNQMGDKNLMNAYLVFTSDMEQVEDGRTMIDMAYRIRSDGSDLQRVVTLNQGISVYGVDCHADSQRLILGVNTGRNHFLPSVDIDGQNLTRELDGQNLGSIGSLTYSPDGQRVVVSTWFSRDQKENYSKFLLVNLLDQSASIFFDYWGINYHSPRWSTDGTKLLYLYINGYPYDKSSEKGISILDPKSGEITTIFNSNNLTGSVDWSPDSTQIVFSMWTGDSYISNIFKIQADGSNIVQLTNTSHGNSLPRWSPDGKWISFSSNRAGEGYQIYTMDTQGNNVHQVTDNKANNYNQCWMPIAGN